MVFLPGTLLGEDSHTNPHDEWPDATNTSPHSQCEMIVRQHTHTREQESALDTGFAFNSDGGGQVSHVIIKYLLLVSFPLYLCSPSTSIDDSHAPALLRARSSCLSLSLALSLALSPSRSLAFSPSDNRSFLVHTLSRTPYRSLYLSDTYSLTHSLRDSHSSPLPSPLSSCEVRIARHQCGNQAQQNQTIVLLIKNNHICIFVILPLSFSESHYTSLPIPLNRIHTHAHTHYFVRAQE